MKPRVLMLAAAMLIGVTAVALGQTGAPTILTLDDAIARGVANSYRVGEVSARRDVADAVVGQRQAVQRPIISAQAGYTRTNHVDEFGLLLPNNEFRLVYPDIPDNYRSRLDVSVPLYTGGRLQAFERAARHELMASDSDIEAMKADVRLDVERAFWALVVADESVRVVNESLSRTSAHLTNVRNALNAGLVPPNEVSTAEAQEARQRMLSIQARSSRTIAEADLARLIGAPPGTALMPGIPPTMTAIDDDIVALTARAVAQRKDRQSILDRRSAAEERALAATALRRPTIAVGGGVDYANPNPRFFPRADTWRTSWDASVNVNWALFDGGRSKAEAAEAVAGKRVLDQRLSEFDSVVALEIRQRLSEIESSGAALDAADAGLRAANEALRVVNDRYAAGVAISSDVLDAQVLVLQSSLDRTQAIASRQLATARLKRALGQ